MPSPLANSGFSLASVAVALIILVAMFPAQSLAASKQLTCSPATLAYGAVVVGRTETLPVVVTNSGQKSVTISSASVSNVSFEVSGLKLPKVLAAGESFEASVTFAPKRSGWAGGEVTFSSNAFNPSLDLTVGGSGVTSDAVTASPAS